MVVVTSCTHKELVKEKVVVGTYRHRAGAATYGDDNMDALCVPVVAETCRENEVALRVSAMAAGATRRYKAHSRRTHMR